MVVVLTKTLHGMIRNREHVVRFQKSMINYIKYLSAVSINFLAVLFINVFAHVKFTNAQYQMMKFPTGFQFFVDIGGYIFILPLALLVIGFFLLKKEIKWLELYWHLCVILSLFLTLICIISYELANMFIAKPA